MAIKFKYSGILFTADTPEEAAKIRALLKKQDAEEAEKHAWSRAEAKFGGPGAQMRAFISEEFGTWTPAVFLNFIERLGSPQQTALSMIVTRRRVTDEELRKALKVPNNQALAGVLSGISKQAAALNISARHIFSFENLRTAGKRRSTYTIADNFLQIATDMNWPSTAHK